ncbi:class I SAM-dependent methyltransferase [Streptomyces sp. NPDC059373]
MTSAASDYWDPLWADGRRYRPLTGPETTLLDQHLGPGDQRLALDLGCGSGALARHLHHLGYRTTAVDCSPAALALAAEHGDVPDLVFQQLDIETDDLTALPHCAYSLITCRLVYAFIHDKAAFLDRVRALLAPGGCLWICTPLASRLETRKEIGITDTEAEQLLSGWSSAHTHPLDTLNCYALHP